MPKKQWYAVRAGRSTGLFAEWSACERSVKGYPGAAFKGFATRAEAESYLGEAQFGGQIEQGVAKAEMPAAAMMPRRPPPPAATFGSYSAAAAAAASSSSSSPALRFAPSLPSSAAGAAAASFMQAPRAHPYAQNPSQQQSRQMHTQSSVRASSVITEPPPLESADGRLAPRTAAAVSASLSSASSILSDPSSAAGERKTKEEPSTAAADQQGSFDFLAHAPGAAAAASSSSAAAAASVERHAVLYADGAAKANPVGPCGCGGILYEVAAEGSPEALAAARRPPDPAGAPAFPVLGAAITCYKRFLGVRSNNESEYCSLLLGMEAALAHGVTHLTVRMDSELVVRQMVGDYRVRAENLVPMHAHALTLAAKFQKIDMQHVYRQHNKEADELANEAIADAMAAGWKR